MLPLLVLIWPGVAGLVFLLLQTEKSERIIQLHQDLDSAMCEQLHSLRVARYDHGRLTSFDLLLFLAPVCGTSYPACHFVVETVKP